MNGSERYLRHTLAHVFNVLCLQKNFELKKDTKCLQVQREEFYNSNQALKNEIRKLRNQMDDSGKKQAVV